MLGAILGDIAGSKYEFNNTFDYDFEMFGEECDFTDDTICTVAIADAILNGRSYQESCWIGAAAITRISIPEIIRKASSTKPAWMLCHYLSISSRKPHLSRMPFASLYLMAAIAIPSEPSSAPSPKHDLVFHKK